MTDKVCLFILFIIIIVYTYIGDVNQFTEKNIDSVLNKQDSFMFEIFEIVVICLISIILYKQKQFILSFVFIIQLLEHVKQIYFCYRQTNFSLNIITILLDIVFMIYSFYKKCYWVIPLFIVGIIIHIISIYYNKSFSNIVCMNKFWKFISFKKQ